MDKVWMGSELMNYILAKYKFFKNIKILKHFWKENIKFNA